MNGVEVEEEDLYEVLNVSRGATKIEIKKAYHKAALSSHPDKVPEEQRKEAEVRFKTVQQAYDILSDDEKRHLYDTHGMAAFKGGGAGGAGPEVDLDDLLQQMFGMGMGGGMPSGPGAKRRVPRKGPNEEQEYEVTLEELYKGKTTRFASTKNIVCETCKGSGGKDKAKPQKCSACDGHGQRLVVRQTTIGLMQETVICSPCSGRGEVFKDKDKCKRCKGNRVVQTRKMLELYIPRGSRQGDKIVIQGEADQQPDQEPGDIVFELKETEHEVFARAGDDLAAEINITLAEALTGFSRVVLTHLDGRGISITPPKGKILRPGQVLKVKGEGMPVKKTDAKGDLFLTVNIEFPDDNFFLEKSKAEAIRSLLPGPGPPINASEVDEVQYEEKDDLDDFGAGSGDPRATSAQWEDDEDMEGGPQCAQQ
ncbi:uncharacterized protein PV09_05387 [Verruconis gallopava]|uniref:Chaperone DnaJ n=1 Tax=Verruconis gallopava TaxID=253628 RepID=A0A0D1YSN3_9PEZI|nr:uncharacterized protein PV09_05387 [Verruconis gallopava]KIW03637.1 hypothetical protein PV09_05387 [Verruconis gallopava]